MTQKVTITESMNGKVIKTTKVTAKTKKSNFEFYNPNPTAKRERKDGSHPRWDKGDCVIRAFCKATGMSWLDGFNYLCAIGQEVFDMPNSRKVIDIALKRQGFIKGESLQPKRGHSRPTVTEFAEAHAEQICVLSLSSHEVCTKDGFYHDVWDCGYKPVYSYYYKNE